MPRVTAIIATYNWATVLPYAIGSVLDQTYTDFELLVVGDGCRDESEAVVEAIDDARVHWHNLATNTGHQSGPNAEGIRRARGDVIAYLGHDDLWLPDHLELLVGAIDDGHRLAHGVSLRVSPHGRPAPYPRPDWVYSSGAFLPPTAMAHDRGLIDDVGGPRHPRETGALGSEADQWARMATVAGPPVLVPRITNVKLPASKRRDVYRLRPCHEQAYWLQRIREAEDPESMASAACHVPYVFAQRVPWRPSRRPPKNVAGGEERRRRNRRFKGLDD